MSKMNREDKALTFITALSLLAGLLLIVWQVGWMSETQFWTAMKVIGVPWYAVVIAAFVLMRRRRGSTP